jgi:hypothetical protein
MEPFPNHTFQPNAIIRRGDLAQAASRVLTLIAAEQPRLAANGGSAPEVRRHRAGQPELSAAALRVRGVMAPSRGDVPVGPSGHGIEALDTVSKLAALTGMNLGPTLTAANQLTMVRMLLIPAFVILLMYGYRGWALVTFSPRA